MTTASGLAVVPAKQERARRTMERVERTARRMLNQMRWEDLSMADLAKKARTSVGSIYARFPNKAALLDHLDEVYCQEIESFSAKTVAPGDSVSFETFLGGFVDALIAYHHANRGLVRTLILETRTKGHSAFHARSKRMNKGVGRIADQLIEIGEREGYSFDRSQIDWALFLTLASVRELTLFPQGLARPDKDIQKGAAEIVAMALRYLGVAS